MFHYSNCYIVLLFTLFYSLVTLKISLKSYMFLLTYIIFTIFFIYGYIFYLILKNMLITSTH
jgi:hypothetical protein